MDRATLMILLVLLGALAYYGYRLARGEDRDDADEFDAGSAILDFARAFPGEAIRSLHLTTDHEAVFVRLHDNRSGFMRNMGNHFACLLLDAKTLRVTPLNSGDGLFVVFDEWPKFTGEYRFNTQEEAADVALWLLASLSAEEEAVEEVEATEEVAEADDFAGGLLEVSEDDDLFPVGGDVDASVEPSQPAGPRLGVDPLDHDTSGPAKQKAK